jgi:hypothetical protein
MKNDTLHKVRLYVEHDDLPYRIELNYSKNTSAIYAPQFPSFLKEHRDDHPAMSWVKLVSFDHIIKVNPQNIESKLKTMLAFL